MDRSAATVDALAREAAERAGLDDFGEPHFENVIGAWCEDLRSDVLTEEGRSYLRRQAVHDLVRRLRIVDVLRRNPDITKVAVPPIVWIIGPPRSGTTLLHNLLAQHRAARPLLRWELVDPVPPPEAATHANDPRIAAEHARVERMRGTTLEQMHWVDATDPEECGWGLYDGSGILGQGFVASLPTYRRYLQDDHDWSSSFREYRRLIQLLLWRNPVSRHGFLVLKAPQFTPHLDPLADVFPEARFVLTHRDPFRVVTSTLTILSGLAESVFRSNVLLDDGRGEQSQLREIVATVGAMMRFADRSTVPIAHVRYADLLADPTDVCQRVLAEFGHPADDDLGRAIDSYTTAQRAGKRAPPPATLPTYGYDSEEIWSRPDIAAYAARVGLRPERRRLTDMEAMPGALGTP